MSKKDREFYKRLKKIQQEHAPEKGCARYPYNWKKEWGPFIKYDGDWDWTYLLDLIVYKLEKMYIALDIYSIEEKESLDSKLKVLKETIDLGKKIQNHDYDKEYHDFSSQHCAHAIYIYKKGDCLKKNSKPIHTIIKWRLEENSGYKEHPMEFYCVTKEIEQWAKENGYDPKKLTSAYGGEWDDKKNQKIWQKMIKEANKALQKDTDRFFLLISRNMWGWWN